MKNSIFKTILQSLVFFWLPAFLWFESFIPEYIPIFFILTPFLLMYLFFLNRKVFVFNLLILFLLFIFLTWKKVIPPIYVPIYTLTTIFPTVLISEKEKYIINIRKTLYKFIIFAFIVALIVYIIFKFLPNGKYFRLTMLTTLSQLMEKTYPKTLESGFFNIFTRFKFSLISISWLYFLKYYFAGTFIFMLWYLFINLYLFLNIISLKNKIPISFGLLLFSVPFHFIWFFIGVWAFYLIQLLLKINFLSNEMLNLGIAISSIYILQGGLVVLYKLIFANLKNLYKVIILLALTFFYFFSFNSFLIGSSILLGIGLADVWADFRALSEFLS